MIKLRMGDLQRRRSFFCERPLILARSGRLQHAGHRMAIERVDQFAIDIQEHGAAFVVAALFEAAWPDAAIHARGNA
jgi:hypothetical protein